MTKKETKMLQEMAANAWEELKYLEWKYVTENYPFGYGRGNAVTDNYHRKDADLSNALGEWHTLHKVMEKLGIGYETSDLAFRYQERTYKWLDGIEEVGA